jgi:glucose-1-phosphate cytidylyltransferase
MKCVILAGGLGTRITEETTVKPKPMVEIGGHPILWHIMKSYAAFGISEFIILCGYKGHVIKDYFSNFFQSSSDFTIDLLSGVKTVHNSRAEPWKVTLIDTGPDTLTGGRLKRVRKYLGNDDFCFTYGDGLADIDFDSLVSFHKKSGKLATVTAVQPVGRFGALEIGNNFSVNAFSEKPKGDGAWINGGFFILSPNVIDHIEGDDTIWEQAPMKTLVKNGQLSAYKHEGFWYSMDTLPDKVHLEKLWNSGSAPWTRFWK